MSKINNNKAANFEPLRANRQGDVKQTGKGAIQSGENNVSVSGDKLQFSDRAAEAGKFLEDLKELPDIREAKVESLREQIAAGEFKPDSDAIADAILKDEE